MRGNLKAKKIFDILEFIFFSNYFYGICAVALSIEALLQQHIQLDGSAYFFMIFLATILYYSYPYVRKGSNNPADRRLKWNIENFTLMRWQQVVFIIMLFAICTWFFATHRIEIIYISSSEWILILIFPLVGLLYYGINFLSAKYNLRKIGWLKPFLIGFAWSGAVTIYPVLFIDIIDHRGYQFNLIAILLFLKNFMFVTILAILFDIKDFATDCMSRIKTFVVNLGLRKTIFCLIFPLTATGLGSFICYAVIHSFSFGKILMNVIPFILLFVVAGSLHKRRPILYYLAVVDGLMLVKGACGIIAISCF